MDYLYHVNILNILNIHICMKYLGAQIFRDNNSYENLDCFLYNCICIDSTLNCIFKERSGVIFSVHFILSNVAYCQLIDNWHIFF